MPQVNVQHRALRVQAHHKVQRGQAQVLVQRLPEKAAHPVPAPLGLLVETGGRAEALLHGQGLEQPVALPGLGQEVGQIDGAQQHRQQHGHGDHGRDHEFFLQRTDHFGTSSV